MKLQLTNSLRCLFLALSLFVVQAYAQTFSDGTGTYEVTTGGVRLKTWRGNTATVTIPGSVTNSGTAYNVVAVAKEAIKGKKNITKIIFSENIKKIDEKAIDNCTKLATIELPASLESWSQSVNNCNKFATFVVASGNTHYSAVNGLLLSANQTKLVAVPVAATNATIPSSVKEIGDYAFHLYRHPLPSIPEGVTKIGNGALNIASINATASTTSITLPTSLVSLGEGVFHKKLATIQVASGNQHFAVENNILYNKDKTKLLFVPGTTSTSIQVAATVTELAPKSIYETQITGITLPNGLKTIGKEALAYNSKKFPLTIPANVTEIGENAFTGTNVTAYTVTTGNPKYSSQDGVLYNAEKTTLILYPKGSTAEIPALPKTLKRIETNAFYGSLAAGKTVVIPAGVTELGDGIFGGNGLLAGVVLPEGITKIPANTFGTAQEMTTIVLPSTIKTIESNAFLSCNSLKTVEFRGKTAPTIDPSGKLPDNVELYVRKDATFQANVWGSIVTLKKELDVVAVNMTSHKYATFHWADKKYAMPAGLRGTTLCLSGSKLEGNYEFGTGEVVKADVALLVNGNEGTYDMVETKHAPESYINVTGNLLFGKATEQHYTATKGKVFALTTKNGKQGFFWQKGTDGTYANTKLHRAYIDVNVPAGVQGFYLEDDILTAIEDVEVAPAVETPIYDLSGRAVQNPGRGLYIVNGKKVLF